MTGRLDHVTAGEEAWVENPCYELEAMARSVVRLEYWARGEEKKVGREKGIVPPSRGECIGFSIFLFLTMGLFVMSVVWWAYAATII